MDSYWVNTDQARDPHSSIRQWIKTQLDDSPTGDTRILVYGHGGCGKSTELAKLVQELSGGFFPVTFSIRDEMNLAFVNPEDILLVLTERLLNAAKDQGLSVDQSLLKKVHAYFAEVTKTSETSRTSELGVKTEATAKTSPFFPILNLLAGVKSEIKLGSQSTESRMEKLRKRPADLLAQINLVIEGVREALPGGQRLLIIVEDLDKLDIASARRVFIENANLLAGLRTNIIYTIPIFTFHSPEAGVLRSHFHPVGMPMIKVKDWQGKRAEGFEVVKKVILQRIDTSAIETAALELLVEQTGGVLQHAFEVIQTAASMNSSGTPLKLEHVQYGLQRKQNEFWSEITLPSAPIEGLKSVDQLYERLAELAQRQMKGEKNPPKVDAINQVLLKSCALIEYNGERWYGVHPLVIKNLIELGRLKP